MYQLWRRNIFYLTYLIFPVLESNTFFLKIGQHTESNLMMYNVSMFTKIIFAVTVNSAVIDI